MRPIYHPTVRIVDIDGTVMKKRDEHKGWFKEPPQALPGAVDKVNSWFDQGDYIIFWTARNSEYRDITIKELDDLGLFYHQLIMDKPHTHNMFIYDDNPITSIRVERNKGVGSCEEESAGDK